MAALRPMIRPSRVRKPVRAAWPALPFALPGGVSGSRVSAIPKATALPQAAGARCINPDCSNSASPDLSALGYNWMPAESHHSKKYSRTLQPAVEQLQTGFIFERLQAVRGLPDTQGTAVLPVRQRSIRSTD
jgi:hypothetical protein